MNMNIIAFERLLRHNHSRKLIDMASPKVIDLTIGYLMECETAPDFPDFDRLMSIGIIIGRSGHSGIDRSAIKWLGQAASSRRLDIVCAFLIGYWAPPFRPKPIGEKEIEMLVLSRKGLSLDEDAAYSYVQAICRIQESGPPEPTKILVQKVLEEAIQYPFSPEIRSLVQDLVEHLSTAG